MTVCEVCKGKEQVKAWEIPGKGWRCNGLLGMIARCNRPKRVWVDKAAGTRIGQADCPLCVRRKIERSPTDDHGYAAQQEVGDFWK